jgi:hypothetical protein
LQDPNSVARQSRFRPAFKAAARGDRALRRAFKLREKLGGDGGIGDYIPKPKWMRWPTYNRKLEEVAAAEAVVDGHTLASVQILGRRLGR